MGEYDLQEKNPCCVGCAKLILIATNLLFLVVGAGTIYSGIWLDRSGWEDVLGDEYSWMKSYTMWFVIGFGILIVVIALAGCCGAMSRSRQLLQCYNIFLVLSVIIFIVLAAASFFMMDVAGNWGDKKCLADPKEETVAADFNRVYCLAESAYACTDLPAEQAVLQFYGKEESAAVAKILGENSLKTLNDACKDAAFAAGNFSEACNWCQVTEKYVPYSNVYEWANKNADCRLNSMSATFCVRAIEADESEAFEGCQGTPYASCRGEFLNNWEKASMYFGISSLVCGICVIVLLVFSCSLVKKRKQYQGNDGEKQPLVGSSLSYSN